MGPAYSNLAPVRSRHWQGLHIHTAGVPVAQLARMTKLQNASADAALAYLAEFAENAPRWIGVCDEVPEKMGQCVPLDVADLPMELVQELMLFAAGVETATPLP